MFKNLFNFSQNKEKIDTREFLQNLARKMEQRDSISDTTKEPIYSRINEYVVFDVIERDVNSFVNKLIQTYDNKELKEHTNKNPVNSEITQLYASFTEVSTLKYYFEFFIFEDRRTIYTKKVFDFILFSIDRYLAIRLSELNLLKPTNKFYYSNSAKNSLSERAIENYKNLKNNNFKGAKMFIQHLYNNSVNEYLIADKAASDFADFNYTFESVAVFKDGNTLYSKKYKTDISCSNLNFRINFEDKELSKYLKNDFKLDAISEIEDRVLVYTIPNYITKNSVVETYRSILGETNNDKKFEINEPWLCNIFFKNEEIARIVFILFYDEIMIEFQRNNYDDSETQKEKIRELAKSQGIERDEVFEDFLNDILEQNVSEEDNEEEEDDDGNDEKYIQFNSSELEILGIKSYENGRYTEAIDFLNYAILKNPKSFIAYYNRGNAFYEIGENIKAQNDFTKTIEINPKFVDAYFNRAHQDKIDGNYNRAIEDYDTVLELDPLYVDAYLCRGHIKLNRFRDIQGAYSDYTAGLNIDPNNTDLQLEIKKLKNNFPMLFTLD